MGLGSSRPTVSSTKPSSALLSWDRAGGKVSSESQATESKPPHDQSTAQELQEELPDERGEAGLYSYRRRLRDIHSSHQKCSRFIPIPDHNLGLVTKIYDGDTFTLACEIAGRPCTISVRIIGVDTPELHRGKCPLEGEVSKIIRDLLVDLCLGKFGTVTCCSMDKYGRLLANLSIHEDHEVQEVSSSSDDDVGATTGTSTLHFWKEGDLDIAQLLLSNGLAYPYDGGMKKDFNEEDLVAMKESCALLRARYATPQEAHDT